MDIVFFVTSLYDAHTDTLYVFHCRPPVCYGDVTTAATSEPCLLTSSQHALTGGDVGSEHAA